jgi:hypothetical protein
MDRAIRQMAAQGGTRADAEQYAKANGWTLDELKAASVGSGLTDVTAPVLQGVSFGFGDEIGAGLRSGFGMLGSYDEKLAEERALVKRAESNNPVGSTVAEIGGAIGPAILTAPLAVPKLATSGIGKLLETGVRLAALGGAEGALYGAGKGETADQRMEMAGEGAAVGAALGPVAGAAGDLVGRGVRTVGRGMANVAAPKVAARGRMTQALERDGMTRDDFNRQFADKRAVRPNDTMAMDAGGEGVRTQAELLAQSPGAARSIIKPQLEARQINQLERLTGDLKTLTGSRETALKATSRLVNERATAAKPLYDQAMQQPVDGAALGVFLEETSRGFGKQALQSPKYRRLLETEYGITNPTIPPQGAIAVDLRLVDGWKKIVQDMEAAALRSGDNNMARTLGDMRRRVVEPIRAQNQAYDDALKAWSGPSQFMESIETGRAFQKMTTEEVQDFMATASAGDKDAYRIGAVTELINRMESDRSKMADFTKFFRGEGMRKKMAALMPSPEAAAKWARIFDDEQARTELTAQALSNSATARRLMARADAEDGDVFGFIMDMSAGTPGLVEMVRGWVTRSAGKISESGMERTNEQMAKMLTTLTPAQFSAMMRQGTPLGYATGLSRGAGGGVGAGVSATSPDATPAPAFPY